MAKRADDRPSSPPEAAPGAADAASDAPQPEDRSTATDAPLAAEPALDDGVVASEDELAADVAAAVTVESLQALLDEARNRTLRAQAELENYRKRTQRTLDEERRFAALPLLRDLLPVVDNLQRAITAAEQHDTGSGLLAGVQLVATQLAAILARHHCTPVPAAPGGVFDPHLHEAMAQLPADDCPPGHISQVVQPGYQLHDRVIRPAQVIVAAPAPRSETLPAEGDAAAGTEESPCAPPECNP